MLALRTAGVRGASLLPLRPDEELLMCGSDSTKLIRQWKDVVAEAFDHCSSVTIEPREDSLPDEGAPDLDDLLRQAAEDPVDAPPLGQLLHRARSVVLLVPDEEEPLHPGTLHTVIALIDELAPEARIEVLLVPTGTDPCIGPGDHRQTVRSLFASQTLGRQPARVRRPDPRTFRSVITEQPLRHPATRRVIPALVDPAFFDADVIIALHRVRPDVQLGLTGGFASVLVGASSPRTLAEVLHPELLESTVFPASPMEHPAHRAFRRIGRALPPVFAIAECPGDESFAYAAGAPSAVLQALATDIDSPLHHLSGTHDGLILFVEPHAARDLETALLPYLHLVRQPTVPLVEQGAVVLVPSAELPATRDEFSAPVTPHGAPAGARLGREALRDLVTRSARQHPLHVVHPDAGELPEGVRAHRSFARAIRSLELERTVRKGTEQLDLLLTRGGGRMLPTGRSDAPDPRAIQRPV
ncbi:MAG: hypothetical protein EA398_05800 [Deltaproteobacteria bacterium]|nr:MAG: hypothetical protein EA398_05800 [Deltaproteobacteria bacterium]